MAIHTLVLLKGRDLPLPDALSVKTLDDAVLVTTDLAFGGEPEELRQALAALIGEALDRQDDARGVFVIPDVAKPAARTYEGVLDEIGEVGEWVPLGVAAPAAPAQPGDLAGMMGQVMGALGGDAMTEMMQALASGDASTLMAMQEKVVAALGGQEQVEALGKQMLGAVQAQNPAAAAELASGRIPDLSGLGLDAEKVAELGKQIDKKNKGE